MNLLDQAIRDTIERVAKETAEKTASEILRALENKEPASGAQLFGVAEFARLYPTYSKWQLYRWSSHAQVNGMAEAGAVIKKNGRVYIHRARLEEWLDSA